MPAEQVFTPGGTAVDVDGRKQLGMGECSEREGREHGGDSHGDGTGSVKEWAA